LPYGERKNSVFLGLGGNIGERELNLKRALEKIAQMEGVRFKRASRVYSTPPYGFADQPYFLNQAVEIETALEPEELLKGLGEIEKSLGRRRSEVKWGPRTIDIDILLCGEKGELVFESELLKIPHPDLHNRAFFLLPLCELDALLVHPHSKESVGLLLSKLDKQTVESCVVSEEER